MGGGGNPYNNTSQMQNSQMQAAFTQLWKTSDGKAQKNGAHRSVYWVKKK
jgi:hypothetical protein